MGEQTAILSDGRAVKQKHLWELLGRCSSVAQRALAGNALGPETPSSVPKKNSTAWSKLMFALCEHPDWLAELAKCADSDFLRNQGKKLLASSNPSTIPERSVEQLAHREAMILDRCFPGWGLTRDAAIGMRVQVRSLHFGGVLLCMFAHFLVRPEDTDEFREGGNGDVEDAS